MPAAALREAEPAGLPLAADGGFAKAEQRLERVREVDRVRVDHWHDQGRYRCRRLLDSPRVAVQTSHARVPQPRGGTCREADASFVTVKVKVLRRRELKSRARPGGARG